MARRCAGRRLADELEAGVLGVGQEPNLRYTFTALTEAGTVTRTSIKTGSEPSVGRGFGFGVSARIALDGGGGGPV